MDKKEFAIYMLREFLKAIESGEAAVIDMKASAEAGEIASLSLQGPGFHPVTQSISVSIQKYKSKGT